MVLSCGHTFCGACLNRLTQADRIRCPTCRQQVAASSVKVNVAIREQAPVGDADEIAPLPRVSKLRSAPDTTLGIMMYWEVHDIDAFLRSCQRIRDIVKRAPGVKYYGFSMDGKVAVSKEGHANVASYMLHLRNVQEHWFEAMSAATMTNMEAHGPKEQVDQLEDTLKDLLSSHWAYADGAFFMPSKYEAHLAQASRLIADDTLCVLVYWDIRNYSKFLAGVKDFQALTKQEERVKYYGFCLNGSKAICREGYDCAEGFLEHLQNVDGPLKAAMEVSDVVRVEVHGPAVEVDKLREPLKSFPAVFWPYPNDSFCAPAEYNASNPEPTPARAPSNPQSVAVSNATQAAAPVPVVSTPAREPSNPRRAPRPHLAATRPPLAATLPQTLARAPSRRRASLGPARNPVWRLAEAPAATTEASTQDSHSPSCIQG